MVIKDTDVDIPLDYLIIQFLKTLLHLGNVDVFAPCLLAFPGRLLVLLGSIGIAREGLENGHFAGMIGIRSGAQSELLKLRCVQEIIIAALGNERWGRDLKISAQGGHWR